MGEIVPFKKQKPQKRFEVSVTLKAYPEAKNKSEALIKALDEIMEGNAIYEPSHTLVVELVEGKA